jgi:hypothetical protein
MARGSALELDARPRALTDQLEGGLPPFCGDAATRAPKHTRDRSRRASPPALPRAPRVSSTAPFGPCLAPRGTSAHLASCCCHQRRRRMGCCATRWPPCWRPRCSLLVRATGVSGTSEHVQRQWPRSALRAAVERAGLEVRAVLGSFRERSSRRRSTRTGTTRAKLTVLDDRHLAEIQMHVQPNRPHHRLPRLARQGRETQWANDTDGSALEAQPDKSQGRPPKSPGSNAHRPRTGLPNMRSPKAPVPVTRP